jgi:hypothetical protein
MIQLTWWDRLCAWLEYDVWCWILNTPMSDPSGGHCTGRRTRRPVYCPDCDGDRR